MAQNIPSNLSPEEKRTLLARLLRKKTEAIKRLPSSFAQERIWFLTQLEPINPLYNVAIALEIKGGLALDVLEQSFNEIIRRHEICRTTFEMVDGNLLQVIAPDLKITINTFDLSSLPSAQCMLQAEHLAALEARSPFDLERGPLLRIAAWKINEQEYLLLLNIHHIVIDEWSFGKLFRELKVLYTAFSNGEASPLPDMPVQYADYAVWQRRQLDQMSFTTQSAYWAQQLANVPTLLELPTDKPRHSHPTYAGTVYRFALPSELCQQLKSFSRKEGVTLFMTLLAAFQTLLFRYTGQDDFCVGTPIANRPHAELENLIGFFLNTLALRITFTGQPTFREILKRTRDTCLSAYAHQMLPFEKIVEQFHIRHGSNYHPFFQTMFVLQQQGEHLELPGLTIREHGINTNTAKFDITLTIAETEVGLTGFWEYNTDLFNKETILRWTGHLQNLLEAIAANPDECISMLPLFTPVERHQILVEWNSTQADYPHDKCAHQLFEEQVERTPDHIAVSFEGQTLTYHELNQRANQLAHFLRDKHQIGPDVLVGICMERSLEMVIALLGIIKAGGAYVPIDPSYPDERIAYMLQNSGARVILAGKKESPLVRQLLELQPVTTLDLQDSSILVANLPVENPLVATQPNNLVYVIYTSGSSGKPKGVMNTHHALVNHMVWMQNSFPISIVDRVLQKTPFSFDASIWEFWHPLLQGACLVIAPPDAHRDPYRLVDLLEQERITVSQFVPTLLTMIMEQPSIKNCLSLRYIFCGGEELMVNLVQQVAQTLPAQLCNLYGPTETCIDSTYWPLPVTENHAIIPIGKPVSNVKNYLLDPWLQPVPIGVPGELYIAGIGLARGYLNRPDLTAEKFIPNPFSAEPGARMYRTGDLARWLPDGNLEYLGRMDHQVKIRGFRIELGEIEAVLAQHPAVRDAVVLAREDTPSDKRLVAYLITQPTAAIQVSDLRSHLKAKLPEYMIPSAFVFLDTFPLIPNGKLDRKALPAPDTNLVTSGYVAPRTPTEEMLASIWADVLKLEKVGIHDNFFELGGHSLLATRVVSRIRKVFQVDLPVRSLFEAPSLGKLATTINTIQNQISQLHSSENLEIGEL